MPAKKPKPSKSLPPKNQEKRQLIVENVIRILANEGIEKFSFENVASAIGMTRQNLLYYFKSRDEMITAAVLASSMSGQKITEERIQRTRPAPMDLLEAVVNATAHWQEVLPDHARVYCLFYYLSTFDSKYSTILSEVVRKGRNRIADIVSFIPESKRPPDLSIAQLGELIHSVIFGRSVYHLLAKGSLFKRDSYIQSTMRMIKHLLQPHQA